MIMNWMMMQRAGVWVGMQHVRRSRDEMNILYRWRKGVQ